MIKGDTVLNTTVKLYTKKNCPLCDKAKAILLKLKMRWEFDYMEVDIYESDELLEKYGLMIPVVEVNGKEVQFGQIDEFTIEEVLAQSKATFLS